MMEAEEGRLIDLDLHTADVIKYHNGRKQKGLFSDAEYFRRVGGVRQYMEHKGLEAVVFTSIHNIAYLSGHVYCSMGQPGRSYGLVITQEAHTTIGSLVDGGHPWRRSWGDNIVYSDWKKDNYYTAIKSLLPNMKGLVGVEFDHLTMDAYQKMDQCFSNAKLVDISQDMMRRRMVKSQEEIDVIKAGAEIADIGGYAAKKAMVVGAMEWEVTRAAVDAMIPALAERWGDRADLLDTWAWLQSGTVNTDGAHNPTTTRKLKKGDIMTLNCFPMAHGYYAALERTMFVGEVDEASLYYWKANLEVHYRGLELVKSGAKLADIAQELNRLYKEKDLLKYRTFGYGHSIGVISYYFGREAGLEIREDIDTILEPGMIITMEPMILIPDGSPGAGGYREHDILIINLDGTVENITKFPLGPAHNIVNNEDTLKVPEPHSPETVLRRQSINTSSQQTTLLSSIA